MAEGGGAGTIEAFGLARRFGSVQAVRPFDLVVGPGGITGLLGPNGSGKSTFLRLLLGITPRHGGSARVDGVELRGDGARLRRRATYVPGESATYGELSGRAHLAWLVAGHAGAALERAQALALELGLPLDKRVHGYSHGMKRQLLLAAALAPRVGVRILDEPTEGLDPTKRHEVLELLRRDASTGTTILLSSHHLGEVDRICDRILFLKSGELLDERAALVVRERAARAVRVEFTSAVETGTLTAFLGALGAEDVRVDGASLAFVLPAGDPRATLGALLGRGDLPVPRRLSFGEVSLAELYRELYGREGI